VHIFGLTGGIASGKSAVAARLRADGLPVIDADQLAREIVVPGSSGLRALISEFGSEILAADGSLDRKHLARIAFSDAEARKRLNAITHPRIAERLGERAAAMAAAGEPLACYEAALLVENGAADRFRPLVVVSCPPETQIARIEARDKTSRADALARLSAQKPLAEKLSVADFVIDTTGPVEVTRRRTDDVLRAICARLGVDFSRYSVSP
jgi:dephospho-CoA kinase